MTFAGASSTSFSNFSPKRAQRAQRRHLFGWTVAHVHKAVHWRPLFICDQDTLT